MSGRTDKTNISREKKWEQIFENGFSGVKTDEIAKARIWKKIEADLQKEKQDTLTAKREKNSRRWILPVVAVAACVVIIGGVFASGMMRKFTGRAPAADIAAEEPGKTVSSEAEMDLAMIQPDAFFTLNGREYRQLSETVSQEELGDLAGIIADHEILEGKKAYRCKRTNCEAVLAIEADEGYRLYTFESFVSYRENRDEDAAEYLKIYGAENSEDIAFVELSVFPDAFTEKSLGKLSEKDLKRFYTLFADLKDSSEAYFQALSNESTEAAEDSAIGIPDGEKDAAGGYTPGYAGTNALDDPMKIHIVFKNGLETEFFYYPNIRFISRWQVNEEMAFLLENYK